MFQLDMRTAIFSFMLISIVSSIILILLLEQYKNRYEGVHFMFYGFILQTAAFILVLLRNSAPPWISFILSNTISFIGIIFFYKGIEAFFGLRSSVIPNLILLIVFTAVHTWFTYGEQNLAARYLNLFFFRLIIYLQFVWLFLYRVPRSMRNLKIPLTILSIVYCLVFLIRIIKISLYGIKSGDVFNSDQFDSAMIIFLQVLLIFLIYSLADLFGKQLLQDIEDEKEKFFKAFHTSPYAIVISKLSDGKIIEINNGFLGKTGYSPDEVYGKTAVELNLWSNNEDRNFLVNELGVSGKSYQKEILFRAKSGESITGLLSSEIITIKNEKCILSSVEDITESKRHETELRKSNELLEKLNKYIFEVRENERKEIGLALHDDFGQRLTGLYFGISWLKDKIKRKSEPIKNKFDELDQMINEIIVEVKEISALLRPAILFDLGLVPAINTHLKKFEIQSGLKCKFHCSPPVEVNDQISLVLFRIFQESLTNIARHSSASNVEITLNMSDNNVEMRISDDGIGISEEKVHSLTSMGIAGMNERVRGLNGKLQISGEPGIGTTVLIAIPIK